MSEMPRIWWSPSRDWFGEVGRETFALVPDYDGPGELPGDAAELTVAAGDGAAETYISGLESEFRHMVERNNKLVSDLQIALKGWMEATVELDELKGMHNIPSSGHAGEGAADVAGNGLSRGVVGYVIGYRRRFPGMDWDGDWYQTSELAGQELSRCQSEDYDFAVFEVRKVVDR